MKTQCDVYEYVCAGTSTSAGVDVAGVVFMVFAMLAALAGPFSGEAYKVLTIVTVANLAMGWMLLLSAVCIYGQFNTAMNAPRELYSRMIVYGEGTCMPRLGAPSDARPADPPRLPATRLPCPTPPSLPRTPHPLPRPPTPSHALSPLHHHGTVSNEIEQTVFGRGMQYANVRESHYTSYPALRPAGPIATYLDSVIDSKTRWDWSPWLFSMGFFANISALMWATVALVLAVCTLVQLGRPAMREKEIS